MLKKISSPVIKLIRNIFLLAALTIHYTNTSFGPFWFAEYWTVIGVWFACDLSTNHWNTAAKNIQSLVNKLRYVIFYSFVYMCCCGKRNFKINNVLKNKIMALQIKWKPFCEKSMSQIGFLQMLCNDITLKT